MTPVVTPVAWARWLRLWSSVLTTLVETSILTLAAAHGVSYNDLGTLTLCLDPATVQVTIESADPVLDTLHTGVVAERLRESLRATLTEYRVPFAEKASCAGEAGFVYSLFYVHWTYQAGEEPTFVFAAALQVGEAPASFQAAPELVLPNQRFDAYTANLLFESDMDAPVHRVLPLDNEQMMLELATAWWDDHGYQQEVKRASQRALLISLSWLSGGVTLVVLLVGLFLLRRRKRLRSA